MNNKAIVLFVFVFIAWMSTVAAQSSFISGFGSSSFVNQQQQPSFQTYYGPDNRLGTYWPILQDKDVCEARQDLLLHVAPGGCQPAVVRSDLLAEQNVPVFCQIDALQINPLLDIKEIKNIRFKSKYPEGIAGVGFHPARAALRTNNILLGSPLVNNIGYVVVVLKKQGNESALPDFVNATLSAQLEYTAGNAYGIGSSEFVLHPESDSEWNTNRAKQSFFNGRYFVRLDDVDSNSASVSLYQGDVKVSSIKVKRGESSQSIFVPGFYCQAAVKVIYDGYVAAQDKARVQISDDKGTDVQDVYYGSSFLEGKCTVRGIRINQADGTGTLEFACQNQRFVLQLTSQPEKEGVKLVDAPLGTSESERAMKQYFASAVQAYESLASDYPYEKHVSESSTTYSEQGLQQAIQLAGEFNQLETKARLLRLYAEVYRNSSYHAQEQLDALYTINYAAATQVVQVGSRSRTITLVDFSKQQYQSTAQAVLSIGGKEVAVRMNENVSAFTNGYIQLRSVDSYYDSARSGAGNYYGTGRVYIDYSCDGKSKESRILLAGTSVTLCQSKESVILIDLKDVDRVARIRLVPEARGPTAETNLTVQIGIEKRAIKLSPEKAAEHVQALNESIKKWESISKNLGTVVSGLKGACFASAAVLTVKNFIEGVGGEALARKDAMSGEQGWTKRCEQAIAHKQPMRRPDGSSSGTIYKTLTECYNGEASFINTEVSARTKALQEVNQVIDTAQKDATQTRVLESVVDTNASKLAYARQLNTKYQLGLPEDEASLKFYSLKDMRQLQYQYLLNQSSALDKAKVQKDFTLLNEQFASAKETAAYLKNAQQADTRLTGRAPLIGAFSEANAVRTPIYVLKDGTVEGKQITGVIPEKVDAVTLVKGNRKIPVKSENGKIIDYTYTAPQSYLVYGQLQQNGVLVPVKVVASSETATSVISGAVPSEAVVDGKENPQAFLAQFGVSELRNVDAQRYTSPIIAVHQQVRYFGYGPYEGLPQLVPFDVVKGWYVKVVPVLGTGNVQKNYDSSGLPRVFAICNVGEDSSIDDKDDCREVTVGVNDNLPIPGLNDKESKELIAEAKTALLDAASQKGNPFVRVNGRQLAVGPPAPFASGTQCQDFMSPEDCKILFNVCDPVICPASRCNFGGKYQVDNVIQSGIIGSALLCLPNAQEGIVVPVCLSGIQAGIDGYVSALQQYRDCLQDNVRTGRLVGICDEIHSLYLCDFFWRQFAPIVNVLVPKLVEFLYEGGQGARGGGEYLTVMFAWENTKKSIDYFTQSYAVNSLKAFQARSTAEVGTQVCKSFVGAKAPNTFKSLLEPDSPTQFFAQFDSYRFSDATVPPTAQYKVFYHIFAGKDQGTQYTVYLKNPPESSYYHATPTILVASGFIKRGETVSQARDFTAPEGYKELCVRINEKEECGFKQVSTSAAVNFLRDQYVKDQLTDTDIQSEQACIYGSPDLKAVLANANPGAALEEAGLPQIYKRGVVRVCSSQNPGLSTAPGRFVEVGTCGSPGLKCWLDKQSVANAITDADILVKNQTLEQLGKLTNQQLEKQGVITSFQDTRFKPEFDRLSQEKAALTASIAPSSVPSPSQLKDLDLKVQKLVKEIGTFTDQTYLNPQRAALLYLKAQVYEQAARLLRGGKAETPPPAVQNQQSPSSPSTSSSVTYSFTQPLDLGNKQKVYIVVDGKETNPRLYVQEQKVYEERTVLADVYLGIIRVDAGSGTQQLSFSFTNKDAPDRLGKLYQQLEGARVFLNRKDITLSSAVPLSGITHLEPQEECTGQEVLECAKPLRRLTSEACQEYRRIEWNTLGGDGKTKTYTIHVCKDADLITYYNQRFGDFSDKCYAPSLANGVVKRVEYRPFGVFVSEPNADRYLEDIAAQLREIALAEFPQDEYKQKSFLASFVISSGVYKSDQECFHCQDRPAYPYEVLYLGKGDCEDSSILLAKFFDLYGFDSVFFKWAPAISGESYHLNNGVLCDSVSCDALAKIPALSHTIDGKRYFVLDVTYVADADKPSFAKMLPLEQPWKAFASLTSVLQKEPIAIHLKQEPYLVLKNPVQTYIDGVYTLHAGLANYGNQEARTVAYTLYFAPGRTSITNKDYDGPGKEDVLITRKTLSRLGTDVSSDIEISSAGSSQSIRGAPGLLKVYIKADNAPERLYVVYKKEQDASAGQVKEVK